MSSNADTILTSVVTVLQGVTYPETVTVIRRKLPLTMEGELSTTTICVSTPAVENGELMNLAADAGVDMIYPVLITILRKSSTSTGGYQLDAPMRAIREPIRHALWIPRLSGASMVYHVDYVGRPAFVPGMLPNGVDWSSQQFNFRSREPRG